MISTVKNPRLNALQPIALMTINKSLPKKKINRKSIKNIKLVVKYDILFLYVYLNNNIVHNENVFS